MMGKDFFLFCFEKGKIILWFRAADGISRFLHTVAISKNQSLG